ncbi:MAG: hypothetical protein Q4C60_05980 [Eubacteriales bacterium]|nr:hypothetical protein [Eubacteriales bacterium]
MNSADKVIRFMKKCQRPLERSVFPALLFLWSFVSINQGVNVADTTYSLGNYRFIDSVGSMWLFATYLSNQIGALLMRVPMGRALMGMNFLTALFVAVMALLVYGLLRRFMPGWMIFIGEWIAIALCWCPTVILYNYLTYFFLTLACLFLFLAETAVPRRRIYFVLAGICLGVNVLVRFSNLPECLLILAVWFYAYLTKERAAEVWKDTGACLGGYVAGLGVPMLVILLRYGAASYAEMIGSLFGMTSQASDYTLWGMLTSTASAYAHSFRWVSIMVACVVMGFFFFRISLSGALKGTVFSSGKSGPERSGSGISPRRLLLLKRLVYLAGIVLLVRFFYGRGMFTVNYQDYWSMFEWGMVFVILAILLSLCGMTGAFGGSVDERFLSALVLLLILITPIGSNNYTFPLLNNLFFIAPFTLWMGRRYWQQTRRRRAHFAWHSMALAVLVMLLVQGSLFHLQFAFGDGTDGTRRTAQVEGNAFLEGMKTTPENAETLTGLSAAVREYGLSGQSLLTFGNAPGLHVILDLPPALSNMWPDLDSYPYGEMEAELAALEEDGETPVIILHREDGLAPLEEALADRQENAATDSMQTDSVPEPDETGDESLTALERKSALLASFMTRHGYGLVYENESYLLYLTPGNGARMQ